METTVKICLLFSLFSAAISSQNGVPAIIWSNDKGHAFPAALTGHSINVQQFKDDYLPHDPKHHMVLFMQDKLSMEDFTQHADVYNKNTDGATFHNLKHIMETESSSHVPSLSSPSSLLETMQTMASRVHTLTSPYNVRDLPLKEKKEGSHLIVVKLPDTVGLHTREALRQIDGILQSVHEQMQSLGTTFTAVYTAQASSKPVGPMVSAYSSSGRHLLQATEDADNNTASFWNLTDGCLFLYTQAIIFEAYKINPETKRPDNLKNYTLPALDQADPASACGNGSAKLVVKYANLPAAKEGQVDLKSFEFTMEFASKKGYWSLNNMHITYEASADGQALSGSNEGIEPRLLSQIFAPDGYSYHCSYQTPFLPNTTDQDGYYVRVRTIQLQGQLNGGPYAGMFGQVNDCIGFFTIPIWSALITMATLLSIFFFGLCMLTSVDTQDRFDDPKGKTIQVNVQE